jgi:hypothetical protein
MQSADPLDQVSFDVTGHTYKGDHGHARVWWTRDGDAIGLYHYAKAPDIEAAPSDRAALRRFYARIAEASEIGLLEVEPVALDGLVAVRMLVKAPQEPSGRTYIASLTLPFRDFSYVLKTQCAEQGMIGMRDSIVLDELLRSGAVRLDGEPRQAVGWSMDPQVPVGPLVYNRSESEEYDARFPEHPLSRARAILRHLEATTRVSAAVRRAAPFVGPTS